MDSAATTRPELPNLRAVICQAEWIIARQFTQTLVESGFSVVGHVQSYESVIAVAVIERPDLVLVDMGGHSQAALLDATSIILATTPSCIVFVCDNADEAFERAALSLGVCCVLVKPLDRRALGGHIRQAYKEHCERIPSRFQATAEDESR